MNPADLDGLEALAKAADQRPWEASVDTIQWVGGGTKFVSFRGNGTTADAAFIAAANPATVLALIALARRAVGGGGEGAEAIVTRSANWIIDQSADFDDVTDHAAGRRKVLAERDLILAARSPE